MITKNDCMSILVNLEDKGLDIDSYMRKLIVSKEIPLDVLQFIAQNQGMEAINFYEMLRQKHNKDKSPLYTNIVKDQTNPAEIILTLSCLLTQIILYAKKLEDKQENFYKEVRAEEITRVLNGYFKDGNIDTCTNLLRLIRADLLVLEFLNGRRERD